MTPVRPPTDGGVRRRGRPPGATTGETRARLLRAAREVFAKAGYRGASIAEIVAAAGVSPPVLYHYFDSKAGLYGAVTTEVYDVVLSRFELAAAKATTLAGKLDELLDASLELHIEDPSLGAFITAAPAMIDEYPELNSLRGELARPTRRFEEIVRSSGEIAPDRVRVVVRAIFTLFIGLSRLASSAGVPDDEYVEVVEAVRLLLRGELLPSPQSGLRS